VAPGAIVMVVPDGLGLEAVKVGVKLGSGVPPPFSSLPSQEKASRASKPPTSHTQRSPKWSPCGG
jgi:hypothetical protein